MNEWSTIASVYPTFSPHSVIISKATLMKDQVLQVIKERLKYSIFSIFRVSKVFWHWPL